MINSTIVLLLIIVLLLKNYKIIQKYYKHFVCMLWIFIILNILIKLLYTGKKKYAIFNKPIKNSNIIHYEVYTNNHIKINTYHKELRLAHNLYNLIIRGYFDLN